MENFDWVSTVASSCHLSRAFEELKLEVKGDIQSAMAHLKGRGANYGFEFFSNGSSFGVNTAGNLISGRAVKFVLTRSAIEVLDGNDRKTFEATLTMNDARQCRFLIDGAEKESWQLRKRALEELFFTSPYDRDEI